MFATGNRIGRSGLGDEPSRSQFSKFQWGELWGGAPESVTGAFGLATDYVSGCLYRRLHRPGTYLGHIY